jgi:hypothetical protein
LVILAASAQKPPEKNEQKKSAFDKSILSPMFATSSYGGPRSRSKSGGEAFIHSWFWRLLYMPRVVASQDTLFYVSKDGKKILQGTAYDIAENPFKTESGN